MTALVTGGAGFIGQRLVARLQAAGEPVRVLDVNPPPGEAGVHGKIGSVCDSDAVARSVQCVDTIFHLAAEHADDVQPIERYYEVNVEGTRKLLEACTRHGVHRLVFTSTVALYGLNLDGANEETPPEPFNHYGASKLQAEQVIDEWLAQDERNRAAIVRPCVVIGPGNRGNVHNLFRQVNERGALIIGDGRNQKSMAYVENVVDFLVHCAGLRARKSVFNYADKPDMATRDLVALAASALGKPGRVRSIPFPVGLAAGIALDVVAKITGWTFPVSAIRVRKFCASSVIDSSKAFASGFNPRVSLCDGVREMIRAMEDTHG